MFGKGVGLDNVVNVNIYIHIFSIKKLKKLYEKMKKKKLFYSDFFIWIIIKCE